MLKDALKKKLSLFLAMAMVFSNSGITTFAEEPGEYAPEVASYVANEEIPEQEEENNVVTATYIVDEANNEQYSSESTQESIPSTDIQSDWSTQDHPEEQIQESQEQTEAVNEISYTLDAYEVTVRPSRDTSFAYGTKMEILGFEDLVKGEDNEYREMMRGYFMNPMYEYYANEYGLEPENIGDIAPAFVKTKLLIPSVMDENRQDLKDSYSYSIAVEDWDVAKHVWENKYEVSMFMFNRDMLIRKMNMEDMNLHINWDAGGKNQTGYNIEFVSDIEDYYMILAITNKGFELPEKATEVQETETPEAEKQEENVDDEEIEPEEAEISQEFSDAQNVPDNIQQENDEYDEEYLEYLKELEEEGMELQTVEDEEKARIESEYLAEQEAENEETETESDTEIYTETEIETNTEIETETEEETEEKTEEETEEETETESKAVEASVQEISVNANNIVVKISRADGSPFPNDTIASMSSIKLNDGNALASEIEDTAKENLEFIKDENIISVDLASTENENSAESHDNSSESLIYEYEVEDDTSISAPAMSLGSSDTAVYISDEENPENQEKQMDADPVDVTETDNGSVIVPFEINLEDKNGNTEFGTLNYTVTIADEKLTGGVENGDDLFLIKNPETVDQEEGLVEYELEEDSVVLNFKSNEKSFALLNLRSNATYQFDKYWDDAGYESSRPSSVSFNLYRADDLDTVVATKTLTSADADPQDSAHWIGKFEDVPLTEEVGGEDVEIKYVVKEAPVNGYTTIYDSDEITGWDVTFSSTSTTGGRYISLTQSINNKTISGPSVSATNIAGKTFFVPKTDASATGFIVHTLDGDERNWQITSVVPVTEEVEYSLSTNYESTYYDVFYCNGTDYPGESSSGFSKGASTFVYKWTGSQDPFVKASIINKKDIDVPVTINVNKELYGETLSAGQFTFELYDPDNVKVGEASNNASGVVTFNTTVHNPEPGETYVYKIIEVPGNRTDIIYDTTIAYAAVSFSGSGSSIAPTVGFYKLDADERIKSAGMLEQGRVYHASPEELVGQAYAKLNFATGDLIFFRDEIGKYTDSQYVGNSNSLIPYGDVIFTGFETGTYIPWSGYGRYVKTVTFKDAIKPQTTQSWFSNYQNLETVNLGKLDTSAVTDMSGMFENCYILQEIDLSSLDVSNVTRMTYMFGQNYNLKQVILGDFDTRNLQDISSMFYNCRELEYINLSAIETTSLNNANNAFNGCQKLRLVDLSSWSTNTTYNTGGFLATGASGNLEYLDISNFLTDYSADWQIPSTIDYLHVNDEYWAMRAGNLNTLPSTGLTRLKNEKTWIRANNSSATFKNYVTKNVEFTKVNENGDPISGAGLKLESSFSDMSWSWVTDSTGSYTLKLLPGEYVVSEPVVPGDKMYKAVSPITITVNNDGTVTYNGITGNNVVLTDENDDLDINITKTWSDVDHEDQRPATLEFDVYNENNLATPVKTITMTTSDAVSEYSWGKTCTDLPKYNNDGSSANYIVKEKIVPNGYITTDGVDALKISFGTTATGSLYVYNGSGAYYQYNATPNTDIYVPYGDVYIKSQNIILDVNHVILDDTSGLSNKAGTMPEMYLPNLFSSYTELHDGHLVYTTNNGTYNFRLNVKEYLPKKDFNVINTYTEVTVTKTWDDEGFESKRPENISFEVYNVNDPSVVVKTITMSSQDAASEYVWEKGEGSLPLYNSDGSLAKYDVREVATSHYTTSKDEYNAIKITFSGFSGSYIYVNDGNGGYDAYSVPSGNSSIYIPYTDAYILAAQANINIEPAVVNDPSDFVSNIRDHKTESEILSIPYVSGTKELTESNTSVLTNGLYSYHLTTGIVPPAYDYSFTNTYVLSADKYWDDAGYESSRPSSITLNLYRADDLDTIVATKTLTSEDADPQDSTHWIGRFEDIPLTEEAGGEDVEIKYVIKEAPVSGYTTIYDSDEITGWDVTFSSTSSTGVEDRTGNPAEMYIYSVKISNGKRVVDKCIAKSTNIAGQTFFVPKTDATSDGFAIYASYAKARNWEVISVVPVAEERSYSIIGGRSTDRHIENFKGSSYPHETTSSLEDSGSAMYFYQFTGSNEAFPGSFIKNNVDVPVSISAKKVLYGETLSNGQFTFNLYGPDGQLVGQTTNDASGNVTFNTTVRNPEAGDVYVYTIEEIAGNRTDMIYDGTKAYAVVTFTDDGSGLTSTTKFYKLDTKEWIDSHGILEQGQVYHASANDLAGEAYASFSRVTGMLRFFRDEAGKYTNEQELPSGEIIFTGIESGSKPWSSYAEKIKTVVFEDAIKPQTTREWFSGFTFATSYDLAKLDTSLVTDMSYMFSQNRFLTEIDLSTLDVSNVTNMDYMFNNDISLKKVILGDFDTRNVQLIRQAFTTCVSLESVNLSAIETDSLQSAQGMLEICPKIKVVDISSWDPNNQYATGAFYKAAYTSNGYVGDTEYLDISNFVTDYSAELSLPDTIKYVAIGDYYIPKNSNLNVSKLEAAGLVKLNSERTWVKADSNTAIFKNYALKNVEFIKVDEEGNPLSNAHMRLDSNTTDDSWTWVTGDTGSYTLKLIPGEYTVSEAVVPGDKVYKAIDPTTITVNNDGTIAYNGTTGNRVVLTDEYDDLDIEIAKTWSDVGHEDQRPTTLVLDVYNENDLTAPVRTVTMTTSDEVSEYSWKKVCTDLPKYSNDGSSVNYVIKERNIPNGYVVSQGALDALKISFGNVASGVVFVNDGNGFYRNYTIAPNTDIYVPYGDIYFVNAPVVLDINHVLLNDASLLTAHTDTIATSDIERALKGRTVELNNNHLEYTTYNNTIGKFHLDTAKYIPKENFNIANTYTGIVVTKTWDDAGYESSRPSSITLNLYRADDLDTVVATKTLTSEDADPQDSTHWIGKFEDVPLTEEVGGEDVEIKYVIKEAPVNGYTTIYDSDEITGWDVTFSPTSSTSSSRGVYISSVNADETAQTSIISTKDIAGKTFFIPKVYPDSNKIGFYFDAATARNWAITSILPVTEERTYSTTGSGGSMSSGYYTERYKGENYPGESFSNGSGYNGDAKFIYEWNGSSNTFVGANIINKKNVDVPVTINVNKELYGEQLSSDQFTFEVFGPDGTKIGETSNGSDGTVSFSTTIRNPEAGETYVYKIKEIPGNRQDMIYDTTTAYAVVSFAENGSNLTQTTSFYKLDADTNINAAGLLEQGTVYHATPQELTGQAYAKLDFTTGELTFFRDEIGKYTNSQYLGNSNPRIPYGEVVFTGFETGTTVPWSGYHNYVKTVVFKDAIKPQSTADWFRDCINLASVSFGKLDTSAVTNMQRMFAYNNNAPMEEIDFSSLDVSNVTDMSDMFNNDKSLKTVILGDFDTRNLRNMQFMFYDCSNLEHINLYAFETDSLENASRMLQGAPKVKVIDLTSWGPNVPANEKYDTSTFYTSRNGLLEYLDISNMMTDGSADFDPPSTIDYVSLGNYFPRSSSIRIENFDSWGLVKLNSERTWIRAEDSSATFKNYVLHDIPFSKVDEDGNPISGAGLKLKNNTTGDIWNWVSSNSAYTLKLLPGTYTVSETIVPGNKTYKPIADTTIVVNNDGTVTYNGTTGNSVVLTDEYDDLDIVVTKTWSDVDNEDQRPATLEFDVYNETNLATPVKTVTMTTSDAVSEYSWRKTCADLPKYNNDGSSANYIVKEKNIPNGYIPTDALDALKINFGSTATGWIYVYNGSGAYCQYNVTPNTEIYVPYGDVYIQSQGIIFDASHVILGDASDLSDGATLTSENIVTNLFSSYTELHDGHLVYTTNDGTYRFHLDVKECIPKKDFSIINTYTDVTVTKTWDDEGFESKRPENISFEVYNVNDPSVVVKTITMSSQDAASEYVWEKGSGSLPLYNSDGSLAKYDVREVATSHYTTSKDEYNAIKITFSGFSGSFIYVNDGNGGYDAYSIPSGNSSIYIPYTDAYILAARADISIEPAVVNDQSDFVSNILDHKTESQMSNLPYVSGTKELTESNTSVSTSGLYSYHLTTGIVPPAYNYSFTNTYVLSADKYWDDAGYESSRPSSITLNLYRADDLDTVVTTKTLTSADADPQDSTHWIGKFEDVPLTEEVGGEDVEIQYVVKEAPVNGYTTIYDSDEITGWNVTFSPTSSMNNSATVTISSVNADETAQTSIIRTKDIAGKTFFIPKIYPGSNKIGFSFDSANARNWAITSILQVTEERTYSTTGSEESISGYYTERYKGDNYPGESFSNGSGYNGGAHFIYEWKGSSSAFSGANIINKKNVDVPVTINVNKELYGEQLSADQFTFEVFGPDGTKIGETSNGSDGTVSFSTTIRNPEAGETYVYKIKEIPGNRQDMIYDTTTAYAVVSFTENGSNLTQTTSFYKLDADTNINAAGLLEQGTVYHATPQELTGQAYAKLDETTGEMIFFRDEADKYTDNQEIKRGIRIFTGFENATSDSRKWGGWTSYIKNVKFKDAIKPKDMKDWFAYCTNLESVAFGKLDTSAVTNMSLMFAYNNNAPMEEIDFSSLDVSNVTDMSNMFNNDKSLKTVILGDFDTRNLRDMQFMFYGCSNLEHINLYAFETDSLRNASHMLQGAPKVKVIDLTSWGPNVPANEKYDTSTFYISRNGLLEYLDISNMMTDGSADFDPPSTIDYVSLGNYFPRSSSIRIENFDSWGLVKLNSERTWIRAEDSSATFKNYVLHDIPFSKVDEDGNPISGAGLKLKNNTTGDIWNWVSSNSAYTLKLLPGTYTVSETIVPGNKTYKPIADTTIVVNNDGTVTYNGATGNSVVLTDEYDNLDIVVTKTWSDVDHEDQRPATLVFDVYNKNDLTTPVRTVTMTTSDAVSEYLWKKSCTDLPKYNSDGSAVIYDVKERNVPNGYIATNALDALKISFGDIANGQIFVNDGTGYYRRYTPAPNTEIYVPYGDIYLANAPIVFDISQVLINDDSDLTAHAGTVPIDNIGNQLHGTVIEIYDSHLMYTTYDNTIGKFHLDTAKYIPKENFNTINTYTEITVTKTWDDTGFESRRPGSITFEVFNEAIPTTVVGRITMTAEDAVSENVWEKSYSGLPYYNNDGTPIKYNTREVVPSNYTAAKHGFNAYKVTFGSNGGNNNYIYVNDGNGIYTGYITTGNNQSMFIPYTDFYMATYYMPIAIEAVKLNDTSVFDTYRKLTSQYTESDFQGYAGSNGIIEVTDLSAIGHDSYRWYHVTNRVIPPVYDFDFSNTYVEPSFSIKVRKVDASGNLIGGAELRITGQEASSSSSITPITLTSIANQERIVSLKEGSYTLHEDSTPTNYSKAADVTFAVGSDGTLTSGGNTVSAVTMVDAYVPHDVVISKKDINGDEIEGAQLKITGRETGASADITPITWESVADENHTVSLKPGSYVLHEEAVPDSNVYVLASDIAFTVEVDGTVKVGTDTVSQVTMTNIYKTHDVVISKVDVNGNEIEGAQLKITGRETGASTDITPITWESVKGENKTVELKPGTYVLHEEAVPNSDVYVLASDITFTVETDGTVKVGGSTVDQVTMTNVYKPHDVVISKQDINGNEIAGAQLKITGHETGASEDITPLTWESVENESHTVSLKPGEYVLHEEAVPNADVYVLASDITFTVEADGTVKVGGDTVSQVTMTNVYKPHDVIISKQDINGNEIGGAQLKITGRETGASADITPITWESVEGENKTFSLKPGEYILHEDAVPNSDVYVLASDIAFTVDTEGTVKVDGNTVSQVTMTDTYKPHEVEISKQNPEGEIIGDATLTINGTETGAASAIEEIEWTTVADENYTVSLKPGTYVLHEADTPSEYNTAADITFVVRSDGTVTVNETEVSVVVMVDTHTSRTVLISKEDENGTQIGDARLTVTGTETATGQSIAPITWTTVAGEDKELELAPGTYTLQETNAPTGFSLADDITFTVESDGTVKVNSEVKDKVRMVDEVETHDISVKKTVSGSLGNRTQEFNFTITFTNGTYKDVPSTIEFVKNGTPGTAQLGAGNTYSFTLKHDEEIIFKGIPYGTTYTVEETDGVSNGYNVDSENETGTVTTNDIEVIFDNYKGGIIPTGSTRTPIVLVLLFGFAAAAFVLLKRKDKILEAEK